MKTVLFLLLLIFPGFIFAGDFTELLQDKSVRSGLCVVVGCKDAESLISAQVNDKYLVQGLCLKQKSVDEVRKALVAGGLNGKISVALLDGKKLPYVDNLANVVVVVDQGKVSREEVMRVVAPYGVALFEKGGKWTKVEKPYPDEMDDWPMHRHDFERSNVLRDKTVKTPSALQWVADTHMAEYMTSQMITSDGRIFYSRSRHMKDKDYNGNRGLLTVRDAFNGLLLWQKETKTADTWERSCLAVNGNRLYTSIDEGMVALDVATGEVLQRYENVKSKAVSYYDGKLILGRGNQVLDAVSGEELWSKKIGSYTPNFLLRKDRMITTDRNIILYLDVNSGKEIWRTTMDEQVSLICLWEDMFFATAGKWGDYHLYAFKIEDGSQVWHRAGGGFPAIVDNLIWLSTSSKGRAGKKDQAWVGLDPRTAEEKKRFLYGTYVKGPRCYPARATEKYLLPDFGGLFFLDPVTGKYSDSLAGRGTCWFGWLPSNGMVYQPVHTCMCYPMMRGDVAYSCADLPPLEADKNEPALIKGAAFSRPAGDLSMSNKDDWPTLRKDNGRRGWTTAEVEKNLKIKWQTVVATDISVPVISAGAIYIAIPDKHQVSALDKASGKVLWSYTAGGKIDSPPTVAGNLVLFGSTDGWAYCLDKKDGVLRWRFRAAPVDQRIICREEIESLWPVHGNLLVTSNMVYVAAGRQAELNEGIFLYALEPATGKVQWQRSVARPDLMENRSGWSVDSCNNRILTADKEAIHLDRHFYDLATGKEQDDVEGMILWGGPMGLLVDNVSFDDSHKGEWFKYWAYKRIHRYIKHTKQLQIRSRNKGNILAIRDDLVFGVEQDKHKLWASPTDAKLVLGKLSENTPRTWEVDMPEDSMLKAIIVAGKTVLVGGSDASGGVVWQFAAGSGKEIAKISLPAVPRFDGLAVAGGELVVSLENGNVVCLSGE